MKCKKHLFYIGEGKPAVGCLMCGIISMDHDQKQLIELNHAKKMAMLDQILKGCFIVCGI